MTDDVIEQLEQYRDELREQADQNPDHIQTAVTAESVADVLDEILEGAEGQDWEDPYDSGDSGRTIRDEIDSRMPLFVKAQNGLDPLDLPEYYELVVRTERSGYSHKGNPQRGPVKYAVRPLTTRELSLLEARGER